MPSNQDDPAAQDPTPADMVLASVRLPGDTASSNIHIRNGHVSAVTAAGERPGAFPVADARVLDLGGRYVIPGLWDEHVHMTQWALAANRIDLSGAASASAAVETCPEGDCARQAGAMTVVGAASATRSGTDVPSVEMLDDVTRASARRP